MEENRRFGLAGKTRYWLYAWLGFFAFLLLAFGGEHRWIGFVGFGALCAWQLIFDPVGRDGGKTVFGIPIKKASKYVQSVFGRDLKD